MNRSGPAIRTLPLEAGTLPARDREHLATEGTPNGRASHHRVISIRVDAIELEAAVDRILAAARAGSPYAVTALAVHGLMTGVQDGEQCFRLNSFDLVCPDGQPVRWALNWLHGAGLRRRVYGPELMARLCEAAAAQRLPIFLFGGTAAVLADLERNLTVSFLGLVIAGRKPSRFRRLTEEEFEADAAEIRASGSRIVFVGLGCPRQEIWVYEMRSRLSQPLVAVGAAFPFHARHLPTAPALLQAAGLEWLFRLCCEPRRLWRRYLTLNPAFVVHLMRQLVDGEYRAIDASRPPVGEQRFG